LLRYTSIIAQTGILVKSGSRWRFLVNKGVVRDTGNIQLL